jgi:uncharacterized MAPEG superfamily protein
MTIALWCVAIAAVLPILCTGIAKGGAIRNFDNRNPRDWLGMQHGYQARANAAQLNSWEALAVFSAGVFAAHLAHAPQARVDLFAEIFIVVRIVYLACYLADLATLRSIVWFIGFGLSMAMFFT